MSKRSILKLNANYFPVGTCDWQTAITDICTGVVYPLDIEYTKTTTGEYNFESVEYWQAVKSFNDWLKLPVRDCDDVVYTSNSTIRLPAVVICVNFKKIKYPRIQFPSRSNVYKRDNFTCGYTGKKLSKHELSVDHVIPKSRGGQNIWENLVTCHRDINSWKGKRTPNECGLDLKIQPVKPKAGLIFNTYRNEWKIFVDQFN